MGYTPVFGTIFNGTLGGQYPDTAAWLFFLALADAEGKVDCTPQHISRVTGMPLDDLLACITRFCAPDPASRTRTAEGRRLVPIDAERPWGWRIVNFSLYRERARLQGKAAREVESGANAARMRDRRSPPETAADRREPPSTASHTQTQTQTEIKTSEARENGALDAAIRQDAVAGRSTPRGTRIPVDHPELIATADVMAWQRLNAPDVKLTEALQEFCDYWRGVPGARGRKLDWPATFRNRLRELQGKRQLSRAARGPVLLPVADG